MDKAKHVHLENKYPEGRVISTENSIDAWDKFGNHVVALRRNGCGQMVDESEKHGCKDSFDLAPIPREARVRKVLKNGNLGDDELAGERRKLRKKYLCAAGRKVLSCEELEAKGFRFDKADGSTKQEPAAQIEAPPAQTE